MNRCIFICLSIFILISNLKGQWEILNQGIGRLRTIDFVNEDVGWIAGDCTLLNTEDGGKTWLTLPIKETYNIWMIDFINESVGWAIGSYWEENEDTWKSIITKSIDGGQTWLIQKELTDVTLKALQVVDDSIVYVVGETMILRTSDGGLNWEDISPVDEGILFTSVRFFTSQCGLVIGSTLTSNGSDGEYHPDMVFVLKTFDGGNTWESKFLPDFQILDELQFLNDSTGYFLTHNDDPQEYFLCTTIDTFKTWTIVTRSAYRIYSFYYIDDAIVYAIMDDSTSVGIKKSTDGGFNWKSIQTNSAYPKITPILSIRQL